MAIKVKIVHSRDSNALSNGTVQKHEHWTDVHIGMSKVKFFIYAKDQKRLEKVSTVNSLTGPV